LNEIETRTIRFWFYMVLVLTYWIIAPLIVVE